MNAVLNHCDEKSPFLLENESAYQQWRANKLRLRGEVAAKRVFELDGRCALSGSERDALERQFQAHGFILFQPVDNEFGQQEFIALNRRFGLHRLDANPGAEDDRVTALRVLPIEDPRAQYIPYSNRAMNWHTDGYYNSPERRVNAFALYCVSAAARGGDNYLFDHEMMYLTIRDEAPELLEVLMQDDLMSVPPNVQDKRVVRAEESGPVFSLPSPPVSAGEANSGCAVCPADGLPNAVSGAI